MNAATRKCRLMGLLFCLLIPTPLAYGVAFAIFDSDCIHAFLPVVPFEALLLTLMTLLIWVNAATSKFFDSP